MKAVIEIAADSRGVVAGLQPANKALDDTAKKAERAEKEVKDLGHSGQVAGRNMSAAFAATGGGLAITHGLEGIASGLRGGSGAMATFAASQALLDLGRFAEDMKGVTEATGGATTIFGTLGAIMKAHPLMTIATVLAGAAAAMALFSDDTEETADQFERLADSMEKVRMSREAAQVLGISEQTAAQAHQRQLITATETLLGPGGMTYGALAQATGQSIQELLRLQQVGGAGLPTGEAIRFVQPGLRQLYDIEYGRQYFRTEDIPIEEQKVGREAGQAILRLLYRQVAEEIKKGAATGVITPSAGAMGPPLPPGFERYADPSLLPLMRDRAAAPTPLGPPLPPGGLQPYADPSLFPTLGNLQGVYTGGGPGQMGVAGTGLGLMMPGMNLMGTALVKSAEYMREQNELAKQRMQELIGLGEQFGQTIGDAFFRVAEGTMTARQAMAELVRMFAQMAAQGIFRQIGGTIGASFAPTQAQVAGGAGITTGGGVSAGQ